MKTGLNIPQKGALDFLSLGALVHRLDPGIVPFRKATHCDIHVSGGEFNVAANLSDCFRLNTGIATAMVDYPIGDLIAERVRAMGVKPFYKHFQHDGVHGPNWPRFTATAARACARRWCSTTAQRGRRAAQARRFRLEGNFRRRRALVPQRRHLRGAFADHRGIHYRGNAGRQGGGRRDLIRPELPRKLWNISGGQERAVAVLDRIVKNVDVLVGNEEDLQIGLGIPGPESRRRSPSSIQAAFFSMMDSVVEKYPQVKIVATTLREVHSTNRHTGVRSPG